MNSEQKLNDDHATAEALTDEKKRPWHLEMAISLTIAGLGTMIWLASTSSI